MRGSIYTKAHLQGQEQAMGESQNQSKQMKNGSARKRKGNAEAMTEKGRAQAGEVVPQTPKQNNLGTERRD